MSCRNKQKEIDVLTGPPGLLFGLTLLVFLMGRLCLGLGLANSTSRFSKSSLPAGNLVLSIIAPEDSREVVAYFPFGAVEPLRWDPIRRHWTCRVQVPGHVEKGVYTIRVNIIEEDATSAWKAIDYFIDSGTPEFDAFIPDEAAAGELLGIEVDPFERVEEVYAYWLGREDEQFSLAMDSETGNYLAGIPVPSDSDLDALALRVVVRAPSRHRFERDFTIPPICRD